MVDVIVREWLRPILGNESTTARVGEEIRQFQAAFYADNWLVQLRDPVRLQTLLDTLVSLFGSISLRTNVLKTKTIVCVPGRIRTCQSQETYTERMEGLTDVGKWKPKRVRCDVCGEDLAVPSI